ncbi:hypothetical protein ABMA58_19220, partial [Oceanospirillum sp. HFRX-1_2]
LSVHQRGKFQTAFNNEPSIDHSFHGGHGTFPIEPPSPHAVPVIFNPAGNKLNGRFSVDDFPLAR